MVSQSFKKEVKKYVGISNWDVFKKNWKKRIGKIFYKKKYNANDILDFFENKLLAYLL